MNKTHNNINQIVKMDDLLDLHCWVLIDGVIHDYEDNMLYRVSAYSTKKIVRKAFPPKLQQECLKHIMTGFKKKKQLAKQMAPIMGMTPEMLLNDIGSNIGNCITKSMMCYKHAKKQGKRPIFVIGSLGFVQKNGDIFYEYG